ncbi:MAG: hypothetical protein SFU25_06105 [Candidatus Caenarcaniphilales bacterium]|nr:hypothetical protein [Candidatus Caenarcaniphilales bacterium]
MNSENNPNNSFGEEENKQQVVVRPAKLLVWGPIYITLNLEKTANQPTEETKSEAQVKQSPKEVQKVKSEEKVNSQPTNESENKTKASVNILSDSTPPAASPAPKQDNTKKVTYVYNMIDHGLDCECIDVKGELLIRSALPTYRKISQGIEFEQITTNQIKLIITSRVLENYQEVFQGFSQPKATFRVWILGYKFV